MQKRINRIYRPLDKEITGRTIGIPIVYQLLAPGQKSAKRFTYDDLLPNSLTKVRVDVIRATGGGTVAEMCAKAREMGDEIDYGDYTQKYVLSQLVTSNIRKMPFIRKEDTGTHKKRYYYAP